MEWYQDFPHVGYDLDGRRIFKPLRSKDELDLFLEKMENPEYWSAIPGKPRDRSVPWDGGSAVKSHRGFGDGIRGELAQNSRDVGFWSCPEVSLGIPGIPLHPCHPKNPSESQKSLCFLEFLLHPRNPSASLSSSQKSFCFLGILL